jgi:hypothetical protein
VLLHRIRDVRDAQGFTGVLERILAGALTSDYWSITLPNELDTSAARSPGLFAFWGSAESPRSASPILGQEDLRFSRPVPEITAHRAGAPPSLPRKWLERQGVADRRHINNIANFAFIEWPDNAGLISGSQVRLLRGHSGDRAVHGHD